MINLEAQQTQDLMDRIIVHIPPTPDHGAVVGTRPGRYERDWELLVWRHNRFKDLVD